MGTSIAHLSTAEYNDFIGSITEPLFASGHQRTVNSERRSLIGKMMQNKKNTGYNRGDIHDIDFKSARLSGAHS